MKLQKSTSTRKLGCKTLHELKRKNPRVKFKLQERWRPRNMQLITDFFVPKEKTLLNTLPTDLENIIDEYTQPRYKKPMHGKIMKDFLACTFFGAQTLMMKLSGLYIGKPKYYSANGFNFLGRGIGFYWQSIEVDFVVTYGENGLPNGVNVVENEEVTKEDEIAFITKHTRFLTPNGSKIENFVPVRPHPRFWV